MEELKKVKLKTKTKHLNDLGKEFESISNEEKDLLFEKGVKSRRREEMINRALGFFTLYCFAIGTISVFVFGWKAVSWMIGLVF